MAGVLFRLATVAALLFVAIAAPAESKVYKCTDPNGVTIFAAKPCGDNAEEIDTSRANRRPTQSATEKQAAIDGECQAHVDAATQSYVEQMIDVQQQIDSLRIAMRRSNNNLAGATRDNAIEQHIAALEARNTSLIEQRDRRATVVLDQCNAELRGPKAAPNQEATVTEH